MGTKWRGSARGGGSEERPDTHQLSQSGCKATWQRQKGRIADLYASASGNDVMLWLVTLLY